MFRRQFGYRQTLPHCFAKELAVIHLESVVFHKNALQTFKGPEGHRRRQRPAFPGSCPPSIIGAGELNYCVRDGNRCGLSAIATGMVEGLDIPSKPNNENPSGITASFGLAALVILETNGQVLDLLVPVSCIHCCTSTSGLSTW